MGSLVNRRAEVALNNLVKRYESNRPLPSLSEVEKALWRAGDITEGRGIVHRLRRHRQVRGSGYIEHWTSSHIGRSFPCAGALSLIRRCCGDSSGRIVDVGAGLGLWTRVLQRHLPNKGVIGLDPQSKGDGVIKSTFEAWCENTGGLKEGDVVLASWLPCKGQHGASLGPTILNSVQPGEHFIYVGSGPNGPVGTKTFYDRLAAEFEEFASEPLPRIYLGVFPRDFIKVYQKRG